MRKVVLFIAMSLDGYIADRNGKVDWLDSQDETTDAEHAYSEFTNTIDTVIMGWKTYAQVTTELSPSQWVYDDFTSYVITHRQKTSTEKIKFVSESPADLVKRLRERTGKDIWICGGASIAQQLMDADLIDRFHLSIIPTVLGDGVRLFGSRRQELRLRLLCAQSYNGITEVIYEKR
ncbi:MAG: dihydrofolate reductase [Lachnospiraceae bacterium]|nr:dihydrofolate reductase [Lachnospiraceae bacterium]